MTFEQAIRSKYSLTFPSIPEDGQLRSFRIDGKLTGFAIKLEGCGAFGDFASGLCWSWNDGVIEPFMMTEQSSEKVDLAFEQGIIDVARGLIANGVVLEDQDINRYALAIQRTGGLNVR